MSFRYRSHQLQDIVRAAKAVREGQPLTFKNYKEHGKHLELELDLKDGPLVNFRLTITAGRYDEPETYRAALLLDEQRIRGVDHADMVMKRFYKTVIPRAGIRTLLTPTCRRGTLTATIRWLISRWPT